MTMRHWCLIDCSTTIYIWIINYDIFLIDIQITELNFTSIFSIFPITINLRIRRIQTQSIQTQRIKSQQRTRRQRLRRKNHMSLQHKPMY